MLGFVSCFAFCHIVQSCHYLLFNLHSLQRGRWVKCTETVNEMPRERCAWEIIPNLNLIFSSTVTSYLTLTNDLIFFNLIKGSLRSSSIHFSSWGHNSYQFESRKAMTDTHVNKGVTHLYSHSHVYAKYKNEKHNNHLLLNQVAFLTPASFHLPSLRSSQGHTQTESTHMSVLT